MKRLLGLAAIFAALFMFASCGNSNTPKAVAEQAEKALQNEDYEKLADLMYIKESKDASMEDQKQMMTLLMKEKGGKMLKDRDGIKSFEILSEEIDESGEKAVVKMKVVYGNGKEESDEMKLVKDKDGNWKLDMGK